MPNAALRALACTAKKALHNAKNPWAKVCGPAGAFVASSLRLGWQVLSHIKVITDRGHELDLTVDSPAFVQHQVQQAVWRWRWRRVEGRHTHLEPAHRATASALKRVVGLASLGIVPVQGLKGELDAAPSLGGSSRRLLPLFAVSIASSASSFCKITTFFLSSSGRALSVALGAQLHEVAVLSAFLVLCSAPSLSYQSFHSAASAASCVAFSFMSPMISAGPSTFTARHYCRPLAFTARHYCRLTHFRSPHCAA